MKIGETELMGSDVSPERFQPMRSVYLSLTVDSADEAEQIYRLLSDGGQVFMPMEETFFAVRFAMLRDKFGTSWMDPSRRSRDEGDYRRCCSRGSHVPRGAIRGGPAIL